MYTKKICFKQYLPKYDVWVEKELRVTNDSLWLHLQSITMNDANKEIVVKDLG